MSNKKSLLDENIQLKAKITAVISILEDAEPTAQHYSEELYIEIQKAIIILK